MRFSRASYLSLFLALLMAGCVVGPDYKKPEVVIPPSWGWKNAEPNDAAIKGDWWLEFNDPVLNDLEKQGTAANQVVQAAVAHVDQSRAVARISKSKFFPQLSFDPSTAAFRTQKNHIPSQLSDTVFTVPLDFSYEVDLWGKIRRSFESAQAQAQATVADYYNVALTLHGDIANNYFLLRQLDAELEIQRRALDLRKKTVDIFDQRFHAGLTPEVEWNRARTELAQAKAEITEMQRQRDDLEHALAVLCGQPSPSFHIQAGTLPKTLPTVPVGLPSKLLERRPDVAEAERKMAAANAQIGVAKAAFFPTLSLTGTAGYSSFKAADLLDWESRFFQFGPSTTLPILNGGRLKAGLAEARANYQATCASYRQQVLVAFKDVTEALSDLDSFHEEVVSNEEGVKFAARSTDLEQQRFKRGLINYLDVIAAERSQLQAERQVTHLQALRLVSTVHLFKALGGGFEQNGLIANADKKK